MSLPVELRQAFAAALRAETDPDLAAAVVARNDTFVAAWCNVPSTFIAWRSRVLQDEIMQNGFDWVRVDNLSVGKARIWEWLFDNATRSIDARKDNVRAGIAECWKGTAADIAVRDAVLGHCKRTATRAEKMFATGTGTDASPGTLAWEGQIDTTDVGRSLNEF